MCAAAEVAGDCGPDDVVVMLLPDSGRGYLSKVFDDDWMAAHGFLIGDHPCVKDVIDAKEGALPPLVYVNPDDPVSVAVTRCATTG